jgi:hypothetical protein
MLDPSNEAAIAVNKSPAHIPGRPHVSTVWRWVLKGVRGIKLETFVVGCQRFTTAEAIERFIAATTAKANGEPTPVPAPRQRQRAIEQAERELADAGI